MRRWEGRFWRLPFACPEANWLKRTIFLANGNTMVIWFFLTNLLRKMVVCLRIWLTLGPIGSGSVLEGPFACAFKERLRKKKTHLGVP